MEWTVIRVPMNKKCDYFHFTDHYLLLASIKHMHINGCSYVDRKYSLN